MSVAPGHAKTDTLPGVAGGRMARRLVEERMAEQSPVASFGEIHAAHRESIVRFLHRMSRDLSLAEDLAQEDLHPRRPAACPVSGAIRS